MKPGQVAAIFGVTTKTVQRWANEDRLPARPNPVPNGHRSFYAVHIQRVLDATPKGQAPAHCAACKGSRVMGGPGGYYDPAIGGSGKPCGTCQ